MKRLLPIIALLGLTACFNGTGKEIKPANHTVSNTETKSPEPAVTSPQKTAEQEKYTAQVEQYTAAIEADPKVPENYSRRAYANYRLGNTEIAGADADKALSLNPKNPETLQIALFIAGYYQFEQDNLVSAKNYFKRASELKTSDRNVLASSQLYLGLSFRKEKQYSKAIEYFSKALELSPSDPSLLGDIYVVRANTYEKLTNYSSAATDYKNSIKYRGHSIKLWESYFGLGGVLDLSKDFSGSLESYNKALELNTMNLAEKSALLNARGVVYLELKERVLACQDFNQSLVFAKQSNDHSAIEYSSKAVSDFNCQ